MDPTGTFSPLAQDRLGSGEMIATFENFIPSLSPEARPDLVLLGAPHDPAGSLSPNAFPDHLSPLITSQSPGQSAPTPTGEARYPFRSGLDLGSSPPSFAAPLVQQMTPGQADLFSALLSLAQPGDEQYFSLDETQRASSLADQTRPPIPSRSSDAMLSFTEVDVSDPEDLETGNFMVEALKLDRTVESNALAYMLECYALWLSRMAFQPLRVAAAGRDHVLQMYKRSDTMRWKLMTLSHIGRGLARNTIYDINQVQTIAMFKNHMFSGYQVTDSTKASGGYVSQFDAAEIFDNTHELIVLSLKASNLYAIVSVMQAAASTFRFTCPDAPEKLIHLPSLLLNPNINLRSYSTVDVLLSLFMNRPMFFRYDTDFTPTITESMLHIEDHLGFQWMTGVPDRLVITLARINGMREDLGTCTNSRVIQELELEIGAINPILGDCTTSDPSMTVARLVVQECWRQAAFIYLYMGLCGANTEDARVENTRNRFIRLVNGSTPARYPDMFLIAPLLILGVATPGAEDRMLLRQRMLNLSDCARPNTVGYEAMQILEDIWIHTIRSRRPAVWSDLRMACLRVAGV